MTLPRVARDSSVFFVRCEVIDDAGTVLAENVYWQSQQRDDLGDPKNDWAFELKQVSWADMTALNWMPRVPLQVTAQRTDAAGENGVTIRLRNPTQRIAFFERAEITDGARRGRDPAHRIQRQLRHGVPWRNRRAARRRTHRPDGRQLGTRRGIQHATCGGADRIEVRCRARG